MPANTGNSEQDGFINTLKAFGLDVEIDQEINLIFIKQFSECKCCFGNVQLCEGQSCKDIGLCICVYSYMHEKQFEQDMKMQAEAKWFVCNTINKDIRINICIIKAFVSHTKFQVVRCQSVLQSDASASRLNFLAVESYTVLLGCVLFIRVWAFYLFQLELALSRLSSYPFLGSRTTTSTSSCCSLWSFLIHEFSRIFIHQFFFVFFIHCWGDSVHQRIHFLIRSKQIICWILSIQWLINVPAVSQSSFPLSWLLFKIEQMLLFCANFFQALLAEFTNAIEMVSLLVVPSRKGITRTRFEMALLAHQSLWVGTFTRALMSTDSTEIFNLWMPF